MQGRAWVMFEGFDERVRGSWSRVLGFRVDLCEVQGVDERGEVGEERVSVGLDHKDVERLKLHASRSCRSSSLAGGTDQQLDHPLCV